MYGNNDAEYLKFLESSILERDQIMTEGNALNDDSFMPPLVNDILNFGGEKKDKLNTTTPVSKKVVNKQLKGDDKKGGLDPDELLESEEEDEKTLEESLEEQNLSPLSILEEDESLDLNEGDDIILSRIMKEISSLEESGDIDSDLLEELKDLKEDIEFELSTIEEDEEFDDDSLTEEFNIDDED